MVKLIKRVNDRILKDEARERGDKFLAFAAALKLSFTHARPGLAMDVAGRGGVIGKFLARNDKTKLSSGFTREARTF